MPYAMKRRLKMLNKIYSANSKPLSRLSSAIIVKKNPRGKIKLNDKSNAVCFDNSLRKKIGVRTEIITGSNNAIKYRI